MSHSASLSRSLLRLRNRYYLIIDLVTLPLAAYLAFVLRVGSLDVGPYSYTAALIYTLLAPLLKIPVTFLLGGYSRYWPFASLPELLVIVTAAAVGELACAGAMLVLEKSLDLLPMYRSIPFIAVFLTTTALALPRLGARLLNAKCSRHESEESPTRRVLIVGAGESGNMVAREIRRNPQLGLDVVGFVDDDPAKQRLYIQDIKVLGRVDDIPYLVKLHRVKQAFIAIPTATSDQMRHIVDVCQQARVQALTLPGVFELLAGRVEVQRFRPVQVEDLLARAPVKTDITKVRELLTGQTVLVTGAGGSIGSELCRQIAACGPSHLVLVGHGENSIYHIHKQLMRSFPNLMVHPVIADTRDRERIYRIFDHYTPRVVVHAAAHKHVPLMEANPEEAVTNNVGGTRNLVMASERFNVQTFVMISTDKAVHPTSVMGATKRIAEHLVQTAASRTGRRFLAVRFGNVLGSRGSVVPLFQQQIESGGPVTVTHPDIERYFMTIPEAVQLVLQAAALGNGGEVFVLDMGHPVKIVDLAKDMIRLAGCQGQVEIKFTGLRPGEKLYEELFLSDEEYAKTRHEKLFVARNGYCSYAGLNTQIENLLDAAYRGDHTEMYDRITAIVPECEASFGHSLITDCRTEPVTD